ncbi:MAG: ribosome small subunit-dependent GTPase A [Defluviitaleaceae bacterium]|nr:ribosome small subunit-dependent GTPase A [Defluviitaleaceae bacterium]
MTKADGLIVKGVGGLYAVRTPNDTFSCGARGIFRKRGIIPLIGDRVGMQITDEIKKTGTIHEIYGRTNELARPRAANVDQAIVVMSVARPAWNAGLLDRYLTLAELAGIGSVAVCANKSDLAEDETVSGLLDPYLTAGYETYATSAESGAGVEALRTCMADKLSLFAGPSGAGKTSLLNMLSPSAPRETGGISEKNGRGKHTTRHAELIDIFPSGLCADTPGFSMLDIEDLSVSQLAATYREIGRIAAGCRFANCRHETESECAVKRNVGISIHPARYESYLRLIEGRA